MKLESQALRTINSSRDGLRSSGTDSLILNGDSITQQLVFIYPKNTIFRLLVIKHLFNSGVAWRKQRPASRDNGAKSPHSTDKFRHIIQLYII
jgi:hypothetical protein